MRREPIRSAKILRAAEGEACTVCGAQNGTIVFCHLNESWAGKGMGQKADDIAGFFGCHECHRSYDTSNERWYSRYGECAPLKAMYKTWRRLWVRGIVS